MCPNFAQKLSKVSRTIFRRVGATFRNLCSFVSRILCRDLNKVYNIW